MSLKQDGIGEYLHAFDINAHLLALLLEDQQPALTDPEPPAALLPALGNRRLPPAHRIRYQQLHLLHAVFAHFDLRLLQGSHCLVLLQLLLIQRDINPALLPAIGHLIALPPQLAQRPLQFHQPPLQLPVPLLITDFLLADNLPCHLVDITFHLPHLTCMLVAQLNVLPELALLLFVHVVVVFVLPRQQRLCEDADQGEVPGLQLLAVAV